MGRSPELAAADELGEQRGDSAGVPTRVAEPTVETGDEGPETVEGRPIGTSRLSGEGSASLGDDAELEGGIFGTTRVGTGDGGTGDELGLLCDGVAETVEISGERRGERKVKRGNGSSAGV